jgi:D-serine deaminase-like pyridoxal phosphate-dependent protein
MNSALPALSPELLSQISSPSLVICRDRVLANIDGMIRVAGDVRRLRPHCKTHKMREIILLLIQRGITKHKAATIAEAEMLADAGATDVLLAYNMVGPNIARIVKLAAKFPKCSFSVTADHPGPVKELSQAAAAEPGVTIGVMLDVNPGLHRTGVSPESPAALEIYSQIAGSSGLQAAGFHVYDGQQRQASRDERREAVQKEFQRVTALRDRCVAAGIAVPVMVCGGTPTFPVYAEMSDPTIELSPGTIIFHDSGYGNAFPDLDFQVAAFVLTRVISRPTTDRMTVDLGNKSVAADPPRGHRVVFPDVPEAVQDLHNEEHLVLVTPQAERYQPGDTLLGIPVHICPTSALHANVTVVDAGRLVGEWPVTSRNRKLTV